ncbi:unnamed protein product [Rotaria socialis]|uniref:Uncharacterized protein n=1 Tax=Rotaria socialis TaxID=392032 RepID=A0A818FI08_9BILA|nr:unnamed protein product [Rotaria socialis]CAF3327525.1 unnamed protein product [Rotaria socialis]CAF3447518.1 unnamed protein product [Rotaria socialis]CAF3475937.1 unnamed protein product [Rotaria socialis]CAF3504492.1 unnamed protein product [Rotaria socialis]
MFSSQACSIFHANHKLSPCRWSASGRSLTGERGSVSFDEPNQSPSQLLLNKNAHPRRHLACALTASLLFFVTGIVAVFYAIKSLNCERHGHYEQAYVHARRSFSWSMASFVVALFFYLAIGLVVFIRTIDYS